MIRFFKSIFATIAKIFSVVFSPIIRLLNIILKPVFKILSIVFGPAIRLIQAILRPVLRVLLDTRVLKVIAQVVFFIAFVASMYWLFNNFQTNLSETGLNFSFRFIDETAGFRISDPARAYEPTDSMGYAFVTGVLNSLRVILLGIFFATILGTLIGIARLSSNWLLRKLATAYVELIRNLPLPLQLHFLYFAAILTAFPLVRESITLFGSVHLHQRGLNMPWPIPTDGYDVWQVFLIVGAVLAIVAYIFRRIQLAKQDRPGFPILWGLGAFAGVALVGWFASPGAPLVLDFPVFGRFNFTGGLSISAAFFALLVGLVIYTASFIAEIVRAGVQSVHKGQTEAAKAAGLSQAQVLRLVVLPQALRVIIPPLTSQYLNLAKNSSLGIIIGYADLFNVGSTIFNQTGRAPEVILMVMASYLSISLLTSIFMNIYNRKIRLIER